MGHNEQVESPLWHKLRPETVAKLIQYQWQEYGTKLDLFSSGPPVTRYAVGAVEAEEADRMMRQKPHHQRRVD